MSLEWQTIAANRTLQSRTCEEIEVIFQPVQDSYYTTEMQTCYCVGLAAGVVAVLLCSVPPPSSARRFSSRALLDLRLRQVNELELHLTM